MLVLISKHTTPVLLVTQAETTMLPDKAFKPRCCAPTGADPENLCCIQLEAPQCSPCGGGDIPEDVLGSLNAAANLSWRAPTRFLVLIGDAPAHGRDCTKPGVTDM